jgi:hypothetical protein
VTTCFGRRRPSSGQEACDDLRVTAACEQTKCSLPEHLSERCANAGTRLNKTFTTPNPTVLKMALKINTECMTTEMLKINWQTRMCQRFIESEIAYFNLEAKHFSCSHWWHDHKKYHKNYSKHWILSRGKILVWLEVMTPLVMNTTVFWDITLCSPIKERRRFGETSSPFPVSKNKPSNSLKASGRQAIFRPHRESKPGRSGL